MRINTKYILISMVWIPVLQTLFTEKGQAECIVGYLWDLTIKRCIPCIAGYYGKNCDDKCPYPLYGLKCLIYCNCSEKLCHHIHGCKQFPEEYSKISTPDSYERTITQSMSTIVSSQKEVFVKKQNQTSLHSTSTTETKWIRSVMFGIIGLAAVSFFLTMIYLYTHKLEKRQITTRTL